ncbi:hypothetical protein ACFO3O_22150 [Dokdonia ponticola]|uniref:Uncharacterized protein n=1 Tax=Dokdonia ponticola TaxID=2041041 RepID=A0ABV9I353_9FLAO
MDDELEKEIQEALDDTNQDRILEVPISEAQSPLNQAVKTGDIADVSKKGTSDNASFRKTAEDAHANEKTQQIIADAPQQHIGEESSNSQEKETPQAIISDKQATQTAEALLGMADNFLAVGGGFFVKITKHEEFFEFEELVEVIDTQNEKNIKRIRLDQDDKALLTPLLAQVIKSKTKQLTPEQQLLGAIISVIVKKAQTVMEVRNENKSLEGRILQIVREAKLPEATNSQQAQEEQEEATTDTAQEEVFVKEQVVAPRYDELESDEQAFHNTAYTPTSVMDEMHLVYEEVSTPEVNQKQGITSSSSKSSQKKRQATKTSLQDQDGNFQDSDDTS